MPIPYGPLPAIALLDPPIPDGDPSVAPSFKELANVRAYARGGLWGQLVGGEWYEVDPASTAAAPVIQLAEISAIALKSPSGVWMTFYTTGTTIGAAEIEGGGPLAPSSWYYLYAYFDGALLQAQFQISLTPPTTAPQPSRLRSFKRGEDGNYRYIGSFPTDASGDPIPLRATGGRVYFTAGAFDHATGLGAGANPLRVLDEGSSTSYADVDLSAVVPPHARLVWLRAKLHDASAGANGMTIRTKGLTYAALEGTVAASDTVFFGAFPIEADASRLIQYDLVAAGAVSLFVVGFEE